MSGLEPSPAPSPSPDYTNDPFCVDRPSPIRFTSGDVNHVRSQLQAYVDRSVTCYSIPDRPYNPSRENDSLSYFDSLNSVVKTLLSRYIYYASNFVVLDIIDDGVVRREERYSLLTPQIIQMIGGLQQFNTMVIGPASMRENKPPINTNTSIFINVLFIKFLIERMILNRDTSTNQDALILEMYDMFNDTDYSFLMNWGGVIRSIVTTLDDSTIIDQSLIFIGLSLMLVYPFQTCTFNGNVDLLDPNLSEKFYNSMMYVWCSDENIHFVKPALCSQHLSLTCNTPQPFPAPLPVSHPVPRPAPASGPLYYKTNMIVNSIDFRTNDGKCSIFSTPGGEYGDIMNNREDGSVKKYVYRTNNNRFFIVANPLPTFATRKIISIYPIEITNRCPSTLSKHTISRRIFQNGIYQATTQKPPTSGAFIENFKNPFIAHLNIVVGGTTRPVNNLLENTSQIVPTIEFYEDIIPRLINGKEFTNYQDPSLIVSRPSPRPVPRPVPRPAPRPATVPIIPSKPHIVPGRLSHNFNTTTVNFTWASNRAVSAEVSISPNTVNARYTSMINNGFSGQGYYTIVNNSNIDITYIITVTTISLTGNTISSTHNVIARKVKAKGGSRKRTTKRRRNTKKQ